VKVKYLWRVIQDGKPHIVIISLGPI